MIYRAPMRARDRDDVPAGVAAERLVEAGLVGIGDGPTPKDARMLERFAALPDGTFAWTRLPDGSYRLGRIAGPLRHAPHVDGVEHVRPAEWAEEGFGDEVPAGVAATFARGGLNFQRIHDATAERRTAELWAGRRRD